MVNMTGLRKRDGDSEADSGFVTPDSTTREKVSRFVEGEEIISHGKDGFFYCGTIVEVDIDKERCLVQFQDNTAHWSLYKDLNKLKLPESDELCHICKSSKSFDDNEIVLCYICEQGYHQNCLTPPIQSRFCEPDSEWECPRCVGNTAVEKQEKMKSRENSPRKQRPKPKIKQDESPLKILPYDINCLSWNSGHKYNKEETYCYCGGPGEWYNRMLQCHRCLQWFHEACIECLHYPLLYGDRFYIFVCSLCNKGMEFIHRLDIRWVDVVHLALFNLTLQESLNYFDYNKSITHWINDNWEAIQAPLSLQNLHVADRNKEVLHQLENNRPRFRCGKEMKKKASLWALRTRRPPPAPTFKLPPNGPITDSVIVNLVLSRKQSSCHDSPPIPRTCKILDKPDDNANRFGPAKKRPLSPCSIGLNQHFYHSLQDIDHDNDSDYDEDTEDKVYEEEEDFGQANGSSPGHTKPLANLPKRKTRGMEVDYSDKKIRVSSMDMKRTLHYNGFKNEQKPNGQKGTGVKRKRGRPPKTPESSSTLDFREIRRKQAQMKKTKDSRNRFSSSSFNHGDTSDDDTSSHGTLDSIIPPPLNFEGQNNPFLNLEALGQTTLPTLPVIRPLKRKLNEKDIRIDKNGEVKRRRFRRKYDKEKLFAYLQNNGLSINGCSSRYNNYSGNSPTAINNCVDYALGARLNTNDEDELNNRPCGDVSSDKSRLSFNDLKSTVNDFFGAANRIANGEKFHILAKRVTLCNQIQYLIEWDTPVSP